MPILYSIKISYCFLSIMKKLYKYAAGILLTGLASFSDDGGKC